MKKTVLLALLVIFSSSTVLGAGWGVITEDAESEIGGLEKNYTLGLVNTGDRPVNLVFSASESPDYDVEFENSSLTLKPSYTTETPQGSDWFYAGGGEYVKVSYTDFTFRASEDRSTNDIEFQVQVSEGRIPNPLNRNVPRQSIFNQREFDYEVMVDKTLIKGLDSDEDSIWGDPGDDQSDEDSQSEQTAEEAGGNQVNSSSQPQNETDIGKENKGINTTTLILGTLLTLTVAYLLY